MKTTHIGDDRYPNDTTDNDKIWKKIWMEGRGVHENRIDDMSLSSFVDPTVGHVWR